MARTPVTSPNPYTFAGLTDDTNIADVDSNWTAQDGVSGYVGVASEEVYSAFAADSDACWAGAGTFSNDQYATIKVIVNSNDTNEKIGVSVRNNGAALASRSLYRAYYTDPAGGGSDGRVVVEKIVSGGSPTNLATISGNFVTSDTLTLEVVTSGSDAVLRVYKNSTQIDSGITDSSSPLASGKPGLFARGGSTGIRGDDWVGGDVTSGSGGALAGSAVTCGMDSIYEKIFSIGL
jgi:hypothetical protein